MAESGQYVVVVRSAPSTAETVGAFRLVADLRAQGHAVTLVLIQDAVLGALRSSELTSACHLRAIVERGVACHYLTDDLALRGYGPTEMSVGCTACDDEALVDVLLADDTRVLGAF